MELHPDRNYGNEKEKEEEFKKVYPVLEKLVKYYTRHSELLFLEDKETEELDLTEEEIEAIRKKGLKVRDHEHWTGEFRGAAHSGCNVLYRKVKKIPVFFHNLSGHDGYFIIESVRKLNLANPPTLISKSLEKYISIKF